jgi:hypothetical protein
MKGLAWTRIEMTGQRGVNNDSILASVPNRGSMRLLTPQGQIDDYWRRNWQNYTPRQQIEQIATEVYIEVIRPPMQFRARKLTRTEEALERLNRR